MQAGVQAVQNQHSAGLQIGKKKELQDTEWKLIAASGSFKMLMPVNVFKIYYEYSKKNKHLHLLK